MLNEKLRHFLSQPEKESERHVIYLTGLAGSGKTNVAKILSERLGSHLIQEFLEPIPDSVMDTRVSSPYEQKLEAQRWVLNQYAKKNETVYNLTGDIVVDRTWIDALIYAQIYGQDVLEALTEEASGYEWHLGLYVILYADEEIAKKRLQDKFGLSETDWNDSWGPYINDLRQSLIELAVSSGLLTIDTSSLSPEEVSEIIESKYRENFK